jgi:hypothetical protein
VRLILQVFFIGDKMNRFYILHAVIIATFGTLGLGCANRVSMDDDKYAPESITIPVVNALNDNNTTEMEQLRSRVALLEEQQQKQQMVAIAMPTPSPFVQEELISTRVMNTLQFMELPHRASMTISGTSLIFSSHPISGHLNLIWIDTDGIYAWRIQAGNNSVQAGMGSYIPDTNGTVLGRTMVLAIYTTDPLEFPADLEYRTATSDQIDARIRWIKDLAALHWTGLVTFQR